MFTGTHRSKKITIVYLITGLDTGGAEMMLYNLLSVIDKASFVPVVISLSDEGTMALKLRELGVIVYAMHIQPGTIPSPGLLLKLNKLIRRISPDMLHGWMYHGNIAALFARLLIARRIPVFWSIHHTPGSPQGEKKMTEKIIRLGAILSRFPRRIFYVAELARRRHAALGYDDKKAVVIPNGVDPFLFTPLAEAGEWLRRELGLSSPVLLVGLIARYHPVKNHEGFLRAAAQVIRRHNQVHCVLAGRHVDHNNQILGKLIRNLAIENHVHFLGERGDRHRIIAALDLLAVSSVGEAFPMVLLEAMSCETPCVSTDVGDAKTIIADTGIICVPNNIQALADAMETMIAVGEEKRKEMGSAARQHILAHYTLESITKAYEKVYLV